MTSSVLSFSKAGAVDGNGGGDADGNVDDEVAVSVHDDINVDDDDVRFCPDAKNEVEFHIGVSSPFAL